MTYERCYEKMFKKSKDCNFKTFRSMYCVHYIGINNKSAVELVSVLINMGFLCTVPNRKRK